MLQQASNGTADLITLVLPALVGALAGVVGSIIATRSRMTEVAENFRLQQLARDAETKAKLQIQYLNPLYVAASDLRLRMRNIHARIEIGDTLLINTMGELKDRVHRDIDYVRWVNAFGHYAVSTLFLTSRYFACAGQVRSDLAFLKMTATEDQALLNHLDSVRIAFGGDFGIWEDLQDSFGSYLRKSDGSLMNYREFANELYDETELQWFHRLVGFYLDISMKTSGERQAMIDVLTGLVEFLADISKSQGEMLPRTTSVLKSR